MPTEWLSELYKLVRDGRSMAALDLLFDRVDDLLISGEFDRCDEILDEIDLDQLSLDTMVGLLTITLPAYEELKRRTHLVDRVAAKMKLLVQDDERRFARLMQGLYGKGR